MVNATHEEFYSGSAFTLSITARFWLYLIPNVLSISCSLVVLFHLLFSPSLRQALNNHVFILLLFIGLVFELFDIPFTLHYYRLGTDWQLTTSFSLFWTYIDFTSYTSQVIHLCLGNHRTTYSHLSLSMCLIKKKTISLSLSSNGCSSDLRFIVLFDYHLFSTLRELVFSFVYQWCACPVCHRQNTHWKV